MKRCPFCAQEIHEKALVCKHCGRDLNKSGSGFGKVFKFKIGYLVGILGLFLLWFAFLVYFPIFPRPDRSGETVTSPAKESTSHVPPSEPVNQGSTDSPLNEAAVLCKIWSCGSDPMSELTKKNGVGRISYFGFSPRGSMAPGFEIMEYYNRLAMYHRPHTKPDELPHEMEYDEVWTERFYISIDPNSRETERSTDDKLAGISYAYWKDGRFVLGLNYFLADVLQVPLTLMLKDGDPSQLERFAYKLINGKWFVLTQVEDRAWFDAAAQELAK